MSTPAAESEEKMSNTAADAEQTTTGVEGTQHREDSGKEERDVDQGKEDETDSSETSSEEEDESEVEPKESPEELVKEAKEMLKQEDFSGALNRFSWAIQKKERLLDSSREYPPELASFFLDYGNALLVKEEHSNELVSFGKGPIGETTKHVADSQSNTLGSEATGDQMLESSAAAKGNDEDLDANITDEQLAWENLEMARMCFGNKMADQKEEGNVNSDDVVDATFVNIRLGDMLTLQEKFADACKEYEAALELRKQFDLPYPRLQAPTLSLAQAQLFAGEPEKALGNFRVVLTLIENNLAGVGGQTVAEEKKADFEATAEDLKIQIKETEKAVTAINEKGEVPEGCPGTVGGRVRILPEHSSATTSTFDRPQLGGEVFNVMAAKATNKQAPTIKKRRIDLSEVNAKMAAAAEGEASSS